MFQTTNQGWYPHFGWQHDQIHQRRAFFQGTACRCLDPCHQKVTRSSWFRNAEIGSWDSTAVSRPIIANCIMVGKSIYYWVNHLFSYILRTSKALSACYWNPFSQMLEPIIASSIPHLDSTHRITFVQWPITAISKGSAAILGDGIPSFFVPVWLFLGYALPALMAMN